MPLTPEDLDALEEVVTEVGSIVDGDDEEDENVARDLFRRVFDKPRGGGIEPIEEPGEVYREQKDTVMQWSDPWDSVYGIDASTTRPEAYNNGLVIDVANAKAAMLGEGNDIVGQKSTIIAAAHHNSDDTAIPHKTLRDDDIISKIVPIDYNPDSRDDIRTQVAKKARTIAEGEHAKRIAPHLDGPLFRDGGIYPMSIMPTLLFAKAKAREDISKIDLLSAAGKEQEEAIVNAYLAAINTQLENGYPVIGIVKTMSTDELIDAVATKNDSDDSMPWSQDDQFMSEVLYTSDPDSITFTTWLVQTHKESNGTKVEPMEGFGEIEHNGHDPRDYRRAWFYVRAPSTRTVFRIEAPLMMVRDERDRNQIRRRVLKEIVASGQAPAVVNRADTRANITQGNAKHLKDMLKDMRLVRHYNLHGRHSDIRHNDN